MSNELIPKSGLSFYGWVPSVTGWLSFHSCKNYTFKGFRALCRFLPSGNDADGKGRFSAIAGRNLNDKMCGFADEGQLLLFLIKGRRVGEDYAFDEEIRKTTESNFGSLSGNIKTYKINGWCVYTLLRLLSIFKNYEKLEATINKLPASKLEKIIHTSFSLGRNGNCTLKVRPQFNAQISNKQGVDDVSIVVDQCFVVLKDFFHTHVAHSTSTDSGVPIISLNAIKGNELEKSIAVKMRRRLHRKFAALIEASPNKALAYLNYLKVYISSVGMLRLDGTSEKRDNYNPLLSINTYDTAKDLLDMLRNNLDVAARDGKNFLIGIPVITLTALATYFQIFGSIDDSIPHISIAELAAFNTNRAKFAALIGFLAIWGALFALPRVAIVDKIDIIVMTIFDVKPTDNLKNIAVFWRSKSALFTMSRLVLVLANLIIFLYLFYKGFI